MGAVWLFGRAELRRRWRALVVLAVLIGIGGGVALTALAGARRTDAAVGQFARYSLPDDGGFMYAAGPSAGAGGAGGAGTADPYSSALPPVAQRVVNLPEVAAWYRLPEVDLTPDPSGKSLAGLDVLASPDADFFHRVDRPMLLAGRLPTPHRPLEAAVNELAARDLHLRVGDRMHLYSYSAAQIQAWVDSGGGGGPMATRSGQPGGSAPAGPTVTVTVTGVFRLPADVSAVVPYVAGQHVSYEAKEQMYLPPAFLPYLARRLSLPVQRFPNLNLVAVRLQHGLADFPAYAKDALSAGHGQVFVGDPGSVTGTAEAAASAGRATRLEALSLLVFGLVALMITVVLVGQGVSRQVLLLSDEHAVLRSLGATRGQLLLAALLEAGLTAMVGAVAAFGVAVAASPLMPIGLARQAEIHPGLAVDGPVLAGGAALLIGLVVLWCLPPAWRASRPTTFATGPSRVGALGRLAGARLVSPAASIGVGFGLRRGSGRQAVPVGGALVAAVIAVAGLSASLTFGSSLSHLNASPREQGWNWDVLVGNPNDSTDREAAYASLLSENPAVGSYSAIAVVAGAHQGNAYIGKVALGAMLAFDPLKGSVLPTLVEGRAPHDLHEIVLGTRTLAELHKRVGDTVQMDVGPPVGTITLRVVGSMISPSVGDIFTNSLGDGGWIAGSAFKAVQAQMPPSDGNGPGPPQSVFGLFAVRFAPGTSPAAGVASLQRQFGPVVLRRLPPADLINLHSVQSLPLILAGLVGALGLGTIGHTLVTSIRRRRRDLALLKTMGFVRRQVGATVAWQATSFVLIALVVGLPLGVASGRWAWHAVASGINSPSPAVVPVVALMLVVPAALVLANLLAAGPGWVAGRVAPALVLRAE
ncbi:MAG TPA: FtsX-like permease family protein [Acidimicrobiales bacterium]|nr:FtsX-like permease family protein [Acidimicrobiales bacterium]